MPLPSSAAHEAVRSYLLHYGYAATLEAFDAAAGLAGVEQPMRWGEWRGKLLPMAKGARLLLIAACCLPLGFLHPEPKANCSLLCAAGF